MINNTQVKITIVDDTPGISYFLKDILEDKGFQRVCYFVDPKAVLSLAENGDLLPDIVITDFNMGELNGVTLLNSLLKLNPMLKGIIVAGSPERALALSRMYPVIDKDSQTANLITELVKKYADELVCAE
jgi:two-component system, NtrC family, response regulator HydG